MTFPSTRAQFITRRTYSRPLPGGFETWEQTVDRVIDHQEWLWRRAKVGKTAPGEQLPELNWDEKSELTELRQLMLTRKATVSGRTLWLGGTEVARRREASQFNCSFSMASTVHDLVDAFWLLLQGCGYGFKMSPGILNGFSNGDMEITVVPSARKNKGNPNNVETFTNNVWRIKVGDSAEAWAKALGKILAGKYNASELILDFSEIRPAGSRLSGYGWISSGYKDIASAMENICGVLLKSAGKLLSKMDLLDIINMMGTALSSRRSAEIALVDYDSPECEEFIVAKKNYWEDNPHRGQSNNSIVFHRKPDYMELVGIFAKMIEAGGSEPGFINGEAALKRAPWFKGVNPCAEILLGDKSFCNLVEVDLGKFNGEFPALLRAMYVIARANYRQTCVNLDDGILQRTWHELNQFLRLCGVGVTGVVRWEFQNGPAAWDTLRVCATNGANSIADELGLPRAKLVTTIKPSGTLSKIMDTTEGIHKPLGKYIFNNVKFGVDDPLVPILRASNYRVFPDPLEPNSVIATFPVAYEGVDFDVKDGVEVNLESAVEQLERYKMVMENYVDHNCSITVSYDKDEVLEIADWIMDNWDIYVGVSFIFRNDPTKTAADLGYPYLPQEVVTQETYERYARYLKPVDLESVSSLDGELDDDCDSGMCPIR